MARISAHSVVELPIETGGIASSIPVLILQNGEVSLYALAWIRDRMLTQGSSPGTRVKDASAVGYVYDFFVIAHGARPLRPDEMVGFLGRYIEAREFGNNLLGWTPVDRDLAIQEVGRFSDFTRFCFSNLNMPSVNSTEKKLVSDLNLEEQVRFYATLAQRKNWDMLYHLAPATELGHGIVTKSKFEPTRVSLGRSKHADTFPPDKVLELISKTTNIRDKLYFLLLFFGSLRKSEPLHLFLTDVSVKDYNTEILLAHPLLSQHTWHDLFSGKQTTTRAEFLFRKYGLKPRSTLAESHPYHSGWKGMQYTKNDYETDLFWLLPGIGEYFSKLHSIYMHKYRKFAPDNHPYYFINVSENEGFGRPATLSNMDKAFYRAAKRVGLKPTDTGVNPHGARHFYGHFCASYLRLEMTTAQRMMHHASKESTEVYYKISPLIVREEIKRAAEQMKLEIPRFTKELKMFEDGLQ
ncbi:tyrosine-type recombinase/integrase [Pseudomonas [fluorescens] ATCC 17400]